ncbi:MAG: S1 RNA-binding domain-containing protein [Oscillospiraceae bacterium]
MNELSTYPPEGWSPPPPYTAEALRAAAQSGAILTGLVRRCDVNHDLHLTLGGFSGRIPREEGVCPYISGASREIALLSRVGKPACCMVTSFSADDKGEVRLLLSRRAAQERALEALLRLARPGTVLPGKVTHLEPFGAFVDIGCGVVALLPLERLSFSRVSHPKHRLRPGQRIFAVVTAVDRDARRFSLSMRELLGTWQENASRFREGETVTGIVRNLRDYGAFIELTPNLAGLAERVPELKENEAVSVYIKSLQPQRMKCKLQIIERLGPASPPPLRFSAAGGRLERWVYSPPGCESEVVSAFSASP